MITVYCYSRCTTCKKALKWLDEKGIAYRLLDIKAEHPDEETLRRCHAASGVLPSTKEGEVVSADQRSGPMKIRLSLYLFWRVFALVDSTA